MNMRLAMRREGTMWNAYIAKIDNMEGAIIIGSISFPAVAGNQDRRQKFLDLMKETAADVFGLIGARPILMDECPAPEYERGGNG